MICKMPGRCQSNKFSSVIKSFLIQSFFKETACIVIVKRNAFLTKRRKENTMLISWLSVLLILLAMSVYPLRILCTASGKSGKSGNKILNKLRQLSRKLHILFGVSATVAVCLHCRITEQQTLQTSPLGSFLLLCLFALIITGMSRKLLPRIWLHLHRAITLILLAGMLVHCLIEF